MNPFEIAVTPFPIDRELIYQALLEAHETAHELADNPEFGGDEGDVLVDAVVKIVNQALEATAQRAHVGYQFYETCDDIARDIRGMKL